VLVLMSYDVEVIITNKKVARDPEGETIHKHLVARQGYDNVVRVRSGKYLVFTVKARGGEEALSIVRELCRKLRIYNPVVHDAELRLRGTSSSS